MDAIGTVALSLGPAFAQHAKLLHVCLLPLLCHLGATRTTSSTLCVEGAKMTLGVLAHVSGHPDLKHLLAGHASVVVDGVCRLLRDPLRHPE